ncbi:MAG: hypothetical protein U0003_05975 [Vampirovibrionales bacterium]
MALAKRAPLTTNHWVMLCPMALPFDVQYATQWGKGSLANTLVFKSANWLLHVQVGILLAMWSQQGSPVFNGLLTRAGGSVLQLKVHLGRRVLLISSMKSRLLALAMVINKSSILKRLDIVIYY